MVPGHHLLIGLSSRRGGGGVKGADGVTVILASCELHFIRVHDNLV